MGLLSRIKSVFRKREHELCGVILLLREPRTLDPQIVERALETAGIPAKVVQEREGWLFIPQHFTLILFASAPYVPPGMSKEAIAGCMGELRLRDAFMEHEGFISVHLSDVIPEAFRDHVKECVNKLAAALVDDTAVLVWDIVSNRVSLPTPKVVAALAEGSSEAFETITWDPIMARAADDADIDRAILEARERFPEFRSAFTAGGLELAMVKAPFETRTGDPEHMWLDVSEVGEETVRGKLVNKPRDVAGLREGSEVTVPIADLSDWMFVNGEGPQGGFVERILRGG